MAAESRRNAVRAPTCGALLGYIWYLRYDEREAAILPSGPLISLVVVLILLYTGWRGWEMVYKHRVAVSDERRSEHIEMLQIAASPFTETGTEHEIGDWFTRLTNAFSKKVESQACRVALHFMYYNLVRIHSRRG